MFPGDENIIKKLSPKSNLVPFLLHYYLFDTKWYKLFEFIQSTSRQLFRVSSLKEKKQNGTNPYRNKIINIFMQNIVV